jgi:predicted histidine transporter YuiF (NhaC family)
VNEIIVDVVGPIAPWLTTLSFGAVVAMRKSIRKRHVVVLVLITVLAFLGFVALQIAGLTRWDVSPTLFQAALRLLGSLVLVCGPAVGFWLVIKQLGFVPDETIAAQPRSSLRHHRH